VSNTNSQALFGFLMDKASKSVHFAIKIAWMFSALSEPKDEAVADRCAMLRRETEHATMNRRRPDRHPEEELSLVKKGSDKLLEYAIAKKERCDYFNALKCFVEDLGNISNRLRFVPIEERNASLKSELLLLNKRLVESPGIYIPLSSSLSPHCCIVNIPPEESVLLNSRERAPYLIIAEVLESSIPTASEQLHEYAKEYQKTFDLLNNPLDKVKPQLSRVFGENQESDKENKNEKTEKKIQRQRKKKEKEGQDRKRSGT